MKKIDKITTLGKMMLKDKITSSWDKLLTEKPQGDLMVFYKKRLEHFWRLPDLEKNYRQREGCTLICGNGRS